MVGRNYRICCCKCRRGKAKANTRGVRFNCMALWGFPSLCGPILSFSIRSTVRPCSTDLLGRSTNNAELSHKPLKFSGGPPRDLSRPSSLQKAMKLPSSPEPLSPNLIQVVSTSLQRLSQKYHFRIPETVFR